MKINEILIQTLGLLQPIIWYVVTCAAVTIVAFVILMILSRRVWVNQKRFRWLGIFYGMSGGDSVCFSCAWLRLLLMVLYLIRFQKLLPIHYFCFLLLGVIYALRLKKMLKIPGRLFWVAVEFVGLLTANMICSYIHDMGSSGIMIAIYVFMSIFMTLFGCYLFLTEINGISVERNANIERERKQLQSEKEQE